MAKYVFLPPALRWRVDHFFQYLTTWTRLTLPHPKALNPDTERELWDWCEYQVRDIGNA
jgi:hypothetical protein